MLFLAVSAQQGGKTVKNTHEFLCLSGRALHISAFDDNLMQRADTSFHLMKHDSEVEAGHTPPRVASPACLK